MKKTISFLLLLLLMCAVISPCASAAQYDPTKTYVYDDIYVTVYGLDQPFVSRIWAVSNAGTIEFVDILGDDGFSMDKNAVLKPNHTYGVRVRVHGMAGGNLYINGGNAHTKRYTLGDNDENAWSQGVTEFTTPEYFNCWGCYPCWGWGWYNPWMPYAPMWGWRCSR